MRWLCFGILFISVGLLAGESGYQNLGKNGVAVSGYDVVSYFGEGGPQKGSEDFASEYNGAKYYFKNRENKERFDKEPQKYAPQFGGWCAYAVADSKSKVEIDPKSFLIQDGRLLLFYNGFWGDTRKKWSSGKEMSKEDFLKTADKNWDVVKGKEP
ncbi:MAG: hypothetical protein KDD25_05420 [Bdellovibrionales bacterium]|nr:hypothetical protein [Bdellovibrionales bacterium]